MNSSIAKYVRLLSGSGSVDIASNKQVLNKSLTLVVEPHLNAQEITSYRFEFPSRLGAIDVSAMWFLVMDLVGIEEYLRIQPMLADGLHRGSTFSYLSGQWRLACFAESEEQRVLLLETNR